MAFKQFSLDEHTAVTVYKRRHSRSLRLTVAADGTVRVSIPAWTPYRAGVEFARARADWIAAQRRPASQLVAGQAIGKAHRLTFRPTAAVKVTTQLRPGEVVVTYPAALVISNPEVQQAAAKASTRALRQQAETLLPQRLASLATAHGFTYGKVTIKQLKSRWGSCDQHGNIVLNLYLMQLPWEHIDYVLLHELTHTRVLQHGPKFWQAMEALLPDVKRLRKALRDYHPVLHDSPLAGVS